MQCIVKASDCPDEQEYPFLNFKGPNIFQWIVMYLTFPIKFFSVLTNYFRIKREKNAIKKHPLYLSGDIHSRNALRMDTRKVK